MTYGPAAAVDDVSLSAAGGENFGIFAPSGAGVPAVRALRRE
jgi:ABC-type branched-subunit amino acid transport system ATPase component